MEHAQHFPLACGHLALGGVLLVGEIRPFKRPVSSNLQVLYFHLATECLLVAFARFPMFVIGVDYCFAYLRRMAGLDSHGIVVPQLRELIRFIRQRRGCILLVQPLNSGSVLFGTILFPTITSLIERLSCAPNNVTSTALRRKHR